MSARIGVLALQGDFAAHEAAFRELGCSTTEVRAASDLQGIDGLVLPGGESTTMLKLIHNEHLWEPLAEFGSAKPIFGTCAGAILLASEVACPAQPSLGVVDISVERNAYGRQVHSEVSQIDTIWGPLEAVFIRAPIIRRTGRAVAVLGRHHDDPVLVEQGRHLVATFHPELTADRRVQRAFLERIASWRAS